MNIKECYDILGLSHNATNEEIKRAYKEIALACHPDKLTNVNDEQEKTKRVDKFKSATVAYNTLTNKTAQYDFDYHSSNSFWDDMSNWEEIWNGLFGNKNEAKEIIKDTFIDIARVFIEKNIQPKSYYNPKEKEKTRHDISVEITYKEIYQKSKKKLRLILVGIEDPIFVDINCGNYPLVIKEYVDDNDEEHEIFINMKIRREDNLDYVYSEKSGYLDIITTVEISLLEYISGFSKNIKYIDGSYIKIDVPGFQKEFFELPKKGLNNGSLIVNISVKNLEEELWERLSVEERSVMVRILSKIC